MTVMAATPPVLLSADPDFRDSRKREARFARLRRGAVIAAVLLHAAVIAALLMDWPLIWAPPVSEKPPITVALVMEPPPAPAPAPPPPPPQAKPTPAQQPMPELHSGPDQQTTAPRQADAKAPDAAPPPQPEKLPEQTEAPALPQPKPTQQAALPTRKTKEAEREATPEPTKRVSVNVALGDKEENGDPYLNALNTLIERHRFYPPDAVGSLGLNLAGTAVYRVAVSASGALEGMQLERSSGSAALDDAARRMIEQAAPFPPLPSYYPRDGVVIISSIPVFPIAH